MNVTQLAFLPYAWIVFFFFNNCRCWKSEIKQKWWKSQVRHSGKRKSQSFRITTLHRNGSPWPAEIFQYFLFLLPYACYPEALACYAMLFVTDGQWSNGHWCTSKSMEERSIKRVALSSMTTTASIYACAVCSFTILTCLVHNGQVFRNQCEH